MAQDIRDFVIGRYRSISGKGPKDVYVKMVKNMIVMRIQGLLTPLEEYMLAQDSHSTVVIGPLREQLFQMMLPDIVDMVEETSGVKVVRVLSEVVWERNERYSVIVLDRDINLQ